MYVSLLLDLLGATVCATHGWRTDGGHSKKIAWFSVKLVWMALIMHDKPLFYSEMACYGKFQGAKIGRCLTSYDGLNAILRGGYESIFGTPQTIG